MYVRNKRPQLAQPDAESDPVVEIADINVLATDADVRSARVWSTLRAAGPLIGAMIVLLILGTISGESPCPVRNRSGLLPQPMMRRQWRWERLEGFPLPILRRQWR
jgi:hypothetical protein